MIVLSHHILLVTIIHSLFTFILPIDTDIYRDISIWPNLCIFLVPKACKTILAKTIKINIKDGELQSQSSSTWAALCST